MDITTLRRLIAERDSISVLETAGQLHLNSNTFLVSF